MARHRRDASPAPLLWVAVVVTALLVTALLVGVVAVTASPGGAVPGTVERSAARTSDDPLGARPLHVDPDSSAQQAIDADPQRAADVGVIAATPQARWFTDTLPTADVAAAVSRYVGGAAAAGATPQLVVYAIPERDCAGFTQGGLAGPAAYAAWIGQVRAGIGGRPAVVVVEPDALAAIDCLPPQDRVSRIVALRDAVTQLSADPSTVVYVDAGHSRWLAPATIAERLRQVGIGHARGFSLNVSNFFTVGEEIGYGEQVSALLGGQHYVVDTSRNGLGPAPDGPLNWCNPPGRALGPAPTTATDGPHADAYLWIKNPGQSDGHCDRGDPASGVWFEQYAVELVRRSGR